MLKLARKMANVAAESLGPIESCPMPTSEPQPPAARLSVDAGGQLTFTLKKDDAGLVAAVIQQFDTNEVLMLAWMDEEAVRRTLTTGRVTFYSRSRQSYWRKGDTSGHVQWVKSAALDCDGDVLLIKVDQVGAACHTGTRTCFEGRGLAAVTGPVDETSASHSPAGPEEGQA